MHEAIGATTFIGTGQSQSIPVEGTPLEDITVQRGMVFRILKQVAPGTEPGRAKTVARRQRAGT
jgi:hypothetical protein